MYAIVQTGGRQYKVSPGDVIEVNRLPVEAGQTIDFSNVLMIGNGPETMIGQPIVPGAVVRAEVADNFRSRKIIVFKYKSKVRYRKFNTHRQDLTRLRIKNIWPTGVPETTEEENTTEPLLAEEALAEPILEELVEAAPILEEAALEEPILEERLGAAPVLEKAALEEPMLAEAADLKPVELDVVEAPEETSAPEVTETNPTQEE